MYRSSPRDGRQSKQQMLESHPDLVMTGSMEQFMAQLYDLTHAIDTLENDVDEIVALRNKIVSLDPRVDVGQVSLRADLDALASLTTQTGRGVISIEHWVLNLHDWSRRVKALVKSGQAEETLQEVGEIKFHIASAKMDFAEAMERIREGAQKEAFRRERARIWLARHIRYREPNLSDRDVRTLLKAAELGAADGLQACPVTSYAGLFALQNPFTELAELTQGMTLLGDGLDTEIVRSATGKDTKQRIINLDRGAQTPKSTKGKSRKPSKNETTPKPVPAPLSTWFSTKYAFLQAPAPDGQRGGDTTNAFDDQLRYIETEQAATEKDLEYGFARQAQIVKLNRRKKAIIALLLVITVALLLFIVLATMSVPDHELASLPGMFSDEGSRTSSSGSSTISDDILPVISTSTREEAELRTSSATSSQASAFTTSTASVQTVAPWEL
ncbi:hypothetical protein JCM8202_004076 [Rhodotorula sphaerocarpa]